MNLNSILFPAPKCSYTIELLKGELIWVPKFGKKTNIDLNNNNSFLSVQEGRHSAIEYDSRITKQQPSYILNPKDQKDESKDIENDEESYFLNFSNGITLQSQQFVENQNKNEAVRPKNTNKSSSYEDSKQENDLDEKNTKVQKFSINMQNDISMENPLQTKKYSEGVAYPHNSANGDLAQGNRIENNGTTKPKPTKLLTIEIKDSSLVDSTRRQEEDKGDASFELNSTDEYVGVKNFSSPKSLVSYNTKAFSNPNSISKEVGFTIDSLAQSLPATKLKPNQNTRVYSLSTTPIMQGQFSSQSKPYFSSLNQEIKIPQPITSRNQGVGAKKLNNHFRGASSETVESYIPCLLLQPETASDKIVIYFHGNGEDVNLAYDLLTHIRNHLMVNVLAVEYPGYGLYKGTPDDATIMKDSEAVYEFFLIKLKVNPQNIIIFGRSIGSGAATYLASQRQVGALILMSAFTSIRDVVKDFAGKWAQYLIKQRFNNLEAISKVKCPIFLIHGQKDKLIPFSHSEELHNACSGATELLLPQLMDHVEFDFYEDFTFPLINFLERCNISLTKNTIGIYFPKIIFKTPDLVLRNLQKEKQLSTRNNPE